MASDTSVLILKNGFLNGLNGFVAGFETSRCSEKMVCGTGVFYIIFLLIGFNGVFQ